MTTALAIHEHADGGAPSVAPVGDSLREERSMVGVILIEGAFIEPQD